MNAVREALEVLEEASEYLDAGTGCVAIAAAEVVAAGGGAGRDDLPPEILRWLDAVPDRPAARDYELAIRAVRRVRSRDSELAQLWAEGDDTVWGEGLDDLLGRLMSLETAGPGSSRGPGRPSFDTTGHRPDSPEELLRLAIETAGALLNDESVSTDRQAAEVIVRARMDPAARPYLDKAHQILGRERLNLEAVDTERLVAAVENLPLDALRVILAKMPYDAMALLNVTLAHDEGSTSET